MNVDIRPPEPGGPPPLRPSPHLVTPREEGLGFEGLLEAVRRKQHRELWLQGVLLGAAAAVVLWLVSGLVAPWSVGLSRALLAIAPVASAGTAVAFGVVLATRHVGDRSRTARLIASRVPELSLDVLGAVELRDELRSGNGAGPQGFSPELANAFLERTDDKARTVLPEHVVDPRPRVRAAWSALAVLGLAVLTLALWGTRWRAGMALAFKPSEASQAAATLEPITGDLELTFRYPAYTGLAPKTVPGTNGEIAAPAGTEVVIKTRSDREVAQANLWVNGQQLPMKVTEGRGLEGSFVVDRSGSYHFTFHNARGKQIAQGPPAPITAQADAVPEVSIQTPAEEIEVDPGEKVVIKFEAGDDYGITELNLVYRLPRKPDEHRVKLRHDEGRRTRGVYTWDVGTLQLQPGDRVTYYVEAKDNDAIASPKRGVSRAQVLKLYSAAEHRRMAMEKASQLWERMIGQLADRLEGPERAGKKELEAVTRATSVDEAGLMLVGDLARTAQEIARERDAPEELWTALANIATSLEPKVRNTTDARRIFTRYHRLAGANADVGRRLTRTVEEEIVELEKDILYLESLIDRQKMQELREMAEQLNRERRELVSLVEQYKQTKDPQLQESILQEIDELRQRIDELMQKMSELAKGIRDEHLNAEALQQLADEQNMGSQMDEIEKLIREGKVDEALKKLQEMELEMRQMLDAFEQGDEQFGEEQYPELAQKMGEFMQELKQTRAEQQQLAEDTKEIRDRYQKQLKEQVAQRARELKQKLLGEVSRAQKGYQEMNPEELGYRADKSLEEVQAQLDAVKNALNVDDFDLAAEAAQLAQRAADEVSAQADAQRQMDEFSGNSPELREQSRELAKRADENGDRVENVNKELQKLLPRPDQLMSEQDRQQMKKLAQEQRELQQQAQELGQKMEEMEQTAPIFGPEGMEQMRGVGERMGEAGGRLEGRDPGRGYGEQKAALEQLDQFQKQLQESQQKRGGGRGGMPMPMFAGNRRQGNGMQNQNDKVEVPDEDAYQAPKEFRKDLLDAMKQGAPDKYKDQVKRYYEELVK